MIASSLSDAQAEALLTGSMGSGGDLEAVSGVLSATRDLAQPDPEADFSALFAVAARESRVTPIERFANEHFRARRDWQPQLIQRVAIAGAVFLVFVGMSPGLAYAADGAKPGDLLYGLDRAFEAVGFDNGGATERLAEVEALIAAGAVTDGLHHAAAVLDAHPGSDEARAALTAAAVRLEDAADSPGSQATQVGALIGYLQVAVASGAGVSGQTVAAMARDLGASQADPADSPADPGSQGSDRGGQPADPGSQADPAGPPADPGSQADPAGPPADPGSQGSDRGGPPTDPGSQGSNRGGPEKNRKDK